MINPIKKVIENLDRRENIRICACGCVVMRTITKRMLAKETKYAPAIVVPISVWRLFQRCDQHKINTAKKADKIIGAREKKSGRGYTKSPKELSKRK